MKGPNICPFTGKPREDCGGCQFLRLSHYNKKKACSLSIFEYEKNNGSASGFRNYLRVILNTVSVGELDPPVESDPTDDIHKKEIHEALDMVLSTLTDRERQILEMRHPPHPFCELLVSIFDDVPLPPPIFRLEYNPVPGMLVFRYVPFFPKETVDPLGPIEVLTPFLLKLI